MKTKITKLFTVLTIMFFIGCSSPKSEDEHGHEHDMEEADHSHDGMEDHSHDQPVEQEEFNVDEDTATHIHNDGSVHQDHN